MPFESRALLGKRILIVEDEAFFSLYLADTIEDAGGEAVGPYATAREALSAIESGKVHIDGASLDVRLADGLSLPVADALTRSGVPFMFVTGTAGDLLHGYAGAPVLPKPVAALQVINTLVDLTS